MSSGILLYLAVNAADALDLDRKPPGSNYTDDRDE